MAAERDLQLCVTLLEVQPSVWRRLVVPASYTLRQLHFAIQQAMPWNDRHLYEFEIAGNRYGAPDPFDDDQDLLDDSEVPLESVATVGGRFRYTYDFGDDWRHDILIEKASPAESGTRCPSCVDGRGAAPPDDVGGPHGYAMFVEAMADPRHPEHAEWRSWIGRDWAPDTFSIHEANESLSTLVR